MRRPASACSGFGQDGIVDLRKGVADRWPELQYGLTSPPAIYKDLVIVGSIVPENPAKGPSGAVRAFDVRSGKLAWKFNTIPAPGEPGSETWEPGASRPIGREPMSGRSRALTPRTASYSCLSGPPRMISMAETGRDRACMPTPSSLWTLRPGRSVGISKRSTMIFGTTTWPRSRSL